MEKWNARKQESEYRNFVFRWSRHDMFALLMCFVFSCSIVITGCSTAELSAAKQTKSRPQSTTPSSQKPASTQVPSNSRSSAAKQPTVLDQALQLASSESQKKKDADGEREIRQLLYGIGRDDPFAPLITLPQGTGKTPLTPYSSGDSKYPVVISSEQVAESEVRGRKGKLQPTRKASPMSPQKDSLPKLKGIILSHQSMAVLEVETAMHIVTAGDIVAGMKVIEIVDGSVTLEKEGIKKRVWLDE